MHNFDDGLLDFIKRFIRYGKGNKQLAIKYNLNLKPNLFLPIKRNIFNIIFAIVQYIFMRIGYNTKY
jgi:hypothetical protein